MLHPGDLVSIAKHEFVIDYNLSASKEALDDIMEEVEGILEKPLLEKAGLAHPPRSLGRPPSAGRLNLPPLTLNDAFDDDE